MNEYDSSIAISRQAALCKEKGYPHFASEDGCCWKCHRNIYEPWTRMRKLWGDEEKEITTGVTVEKATNELITGCPHCHKSYCD